MADLYTDKMSIAEYRILVRGFDDKSNTKTLLRKIVREQGLVKPTPIEELPVDAWSTTEWLLASVIDELRHLEWLYRARNRKDKTPCPPHPEPFPRPGGQPRRRKRINSLFAAFGLPPLGVVDP